MQHYRYPIFKKNIKNDLLIEKFGESCSDYLKIEFQICNNTLTDIWFDGNGCAFFIASSDILIKQIINKNLNEIHYILNLFEKLILGDELLSETEKEELKELMIFENVKTHFNRTHCCLMLQRLLKNELNNKNE
ncbi:iron-sulfur cluster assembly scaffold protein [Mycoplasma sp. 1018B]|nr:iron-sulfur cluster assembly scaffold protein [Mycoplasma sp. 1018B]UUM19070.1 iron-sulfur cluster assembly scaffold protein [Mycoplasma sp. 1018B]